MKFTDRERRIWAELERQLTGEPSAAAATPAEDQPATGPRSTARPVATAAGVLGLLLVAVGIPLGVAGSVLFGLLLVCWWLSPRLGPPVRRAGRYVLEAVADGPTEGPPGRSER